MDNNSRIQSIGCDPVRYYNYFVPHNLEESRPSKSSKSESISNHIKQSEFSEYSYAITETSRNDNQANS